MKNRGFTLVELLAILVVLAIIAIIAVPNILNGIEESRKGHAKVSALGYIEAIEDNNKLVGTDPSIKEISGSDVDIDTIDVKLKGTKPDSGYVSIDEDGLVEYAELCIGKYKVTYSSENTIVTKSESCSVLKPGLYDENDNLLASWDKLVNEYELNIVDYYDTEEGNTFKYILDTYYSDYNEVKLVIAHGIKNIDNEAFAECNKLISVIIPEGVTTIGDSAFYYCENLKSVVIPEGVTTIGNYAFSDCENLKSITIPSSVKIIGFGSFSQCESLKSVVIPEGVESIKSWAFYGCDELTSITIPSSVIEIQNLAFAACKKLLIIDVDRDNPNYLSDDGVLFNKDKTTIVAYPRGKMNNSYTIPDTVETIFDGAFYACNLTNIVIPEGVTTIGAFAFKFCDELTSITIPSSVKIIEYEAFQECEKLENVIISEGVTTIGKRAFINTNLSSVTFKDISGWYYEPLNGGTNVNLTLTDPSTNARYLKETYNLGVWKKSS